MAETKDQRGEPQDGQESTELKIALLASLCDCSDTDLLLEALIACHGDVDSASRALTSQLAPPAKRQKLYHPSTQASILRYAQDSDSKQGRKFAQPTKKGKVLHLYSPDEIAKLTPCTILHNFLPRETADALLKELLDESPHYYTDKFKLFDRVVTSPHTLCFYVDDWDPAKPNDDYVYNGQPVHGIRTTPPLMRRVGQLVQQQVNVEIKRRIAEHYPNKEKLRYQASNAWTPNSALVNCYDGGRESVGFHSDDETHSGPRSVIGSMSLGVAREFRVRRIIPERHDLDAASKRADAQGQIAIHLPHNSLLVMHAEMQSEWKHSIAAAHTVEPHPTSGNKRLNITYRCNRQSLQSRKLPRCKCGMQVVLRCVQRQAATQGRYMWTCQAGQAPELKRYVGKSCLLSVSCDYFAWANFDDEGEPIWAVSKQDEQLHGAYDSRNTEAQTSVDGSSLAKLHPILQHTVINTIDK